MPRGGVSHHPSDCTKVKMQLIDATSGALRGSA